LDKNLDDNQKFDSWKNKRFNYIFDKFYYLVLNIAKEYSEYEEALDICQEVFFSLYCRYNLSLPDKDIKALLIRITTTTAIDHYRKRGRDIKSYSLWFQEKILESNKFGYNLESDVMMRELYSTILEEIKNMRPEWGDILLLHSVLQIPQDRVAEILDIPITALRSRLNRARTYLKVRYGDEIKYWH